MKMHNSDAESHNSGIEIISGVIIQESKKTREFTVRCLDGAKRVITVPAKADKTVPMMDNIREGVHVIIHHTRSGPKTIATYSTIQKDTNSTD